MSDNESSAKRRKTDDLEDSKADSLSIEETNKLRAKLGLAPLEATSDQPADDGTLKANDGTAFKHVPAESITDKKKSEKLREKIEKRKKQRDIDNKLKKVKGLGESDSDDDGIKNWVKKSRKIEAQKKKAAKRERAIKEREREIEEETRIIEEEKRQRSYRGNALAGMTVEHDLENFGEGRDVIMTYPWVPGYRSRRPLIMTLKDSKILDEEAGKSEGDTLVNVNMVDDERAKQYVKNVKDAKNKTGYNPMEKFDSETAEMEAFGEKKLLSKYDETIDGEKKKRFQIGEDGKISTVMMDIRKQMRDEMTKNAISLNSGDIKIASDYLTPEEAQGFKKRKRKVKKVRKTGITLMDDVLERRGFKDDPFDGSSKGSKDHGSRNFKRGDDEKDTKKEEITITEEELQAQLDAAAKNIGEERKVVDTVKKDVMVSSSLARTRRLLQSRAKMEIRDPAQALRDRISQIKTKEENSEDMDVKEELVLNDVDEFCRAVGQANAEKIHEREKEIKQENSEVKVQKATEVEIDVEKEYRKIKNKRAGIRERVQDEIEDNVEREPLCSGGLAGAIKVAMAKGFIDKDVNHGKKGVVVDKKHKDRISAQSYSIEDKNRVDHLDKYAADKYRRDSRRDKSSALSEFPELKDYKPNIQIEYVDEIGRAKTEKEAFRDLSHRFHGKGSGKMKQEKRAKRLQEDSALRQMSSTDTPLNTVEMLRRKQKHLNTPYINLTGGAMLSAGAKISKK